MSPGRRSVAVLPLQLFLAACVVDDLPDPRDDRGDLGPSQDDLKARAPASPLAGSSAPVPAADAGAMDAGATDAGAADGGVVVDGGVADGGVPDGGVADGGAPDAGCAAVLVATPAEVDFGSRQVGTDNRESTTITNTCDAAVLLFVDGTLPDDFALGTGTGQPCSLFEPGELLVPGDSCEVVVLFRPTEFFIGFDARFSLVATATAPASGALVAELLIPVHGLVVP
jgi:hypothetical protein